MLRVSEIFTSIQGESTRAGLRCMFIRLAGCNLRCRWCDTPYALARDGGTERPVEDILREAAHESCRLVEVTGGEPLLQPEAFGLVARLLDEGFETLVETNGSLPLGALDPRAVKIVDVKCPGSGECGMFLEANLASLTGRDELKFVLAAREDFDWAVRFISERRLAGKLEILFSPARGLLEPAALAGWMVAEAGLRARLQVPLQSILWPERTRGV